MKRTLFALATIAALGACKKNPAPTAAPDAALAPSSSAGTTASEAVAPEKEALTDLLYATHVVVSVSSRVANPKDFPEHLVDRKKETAWNSKTGDLVGGWIGVRVPKMSHVARFELSAGFDATSRDGTDLFTANHRIKRVRVSKDGKALGEHELSVDVRKPQAIPVDQDGGDFKIEILETVAGTKASWKELAVSELFVLGTPGAGAPPPKGPPRVYVGSFSPPRPSYETYRERISRACFASPAAFCAEQKAAMAPLLPKFQKQLRDEYPSDYVLTASCTTKPSPLLKASGPFLELATATFEDGSSDDTTALVRTAKGWRLAEGLWSSSHSHLDLGCPVNMRESSLHGVTVAEGTTQPTLVVTTHSEYLVAKLRFVHTCALRADESLDCTAPKLINDTKRAECPSEPALCKFEPWGPDDKYTVGADSSVTVHAKRKLPDLGMYHGPP